MEKRFLITLVVLGTLAMLALWIVVAALFIIPQYEIAREAELESVANTILILQGVASFVVGRLCAKLCIKAIDTINGQED